MALETKALGVISLVNTETEKRPFIVVFVNLKHDKHLCSHLKCRAKARVFTSIGKSIASQSRLVRPCFFSWKRRRFAHHYAKKKKGSITQTTPQTAHIPHHWNGYIRVRDKHTRRLATTTELTLYPPGLWSHYVFLFDNSRKSLKKSLDTMLYFLASITVSNLHPLHFEGFLVSFMHHLLQTLLGRISSSSHLCQLGP
jgi:hypothetical protein